MIARTFEDIAIDEAWTPETQVAVLLNYIRNQEDDAALTEFCERMIAEENAP